MVNFILLAFSAGCLYAGFVAGAKYKTLSELWRNLKLFAAGMLKS